MKAHPVVVHGQVTLSDGASVSFLADGETGGSSIWGGYPSQRDAAQPMVDRIVSALQGVTP